MNASSTPRPVPDRPLNALDIADGAFALLRSRPRVVAAIAASIVLPAQLLSTFLDRDVFSDFSFDNFNSETGEFEGQDPFGGFGFFQGSPIVTFIQFLVLPFLGVALTYLVLGWKAGEERSAKDCLLFTARKSHIIVAAFILSKIIQVFTLLLTTPMTMLVAPVLAAEGLGPFAAIRRSFVLGRRRYGALFALLLLIILINVLLTYATLTIPVIGAFLLGDWGWIAFFALGSVGTTVLNLLGAGAAVWAYFDVLNRTEGTDIRQRLHVASSSTASTPHH